jgi:REP element-mobilizing transposase RayT
MKVVRGLPSLRTWEIAAALGKAIRDGKERKGFRIVEFSIQWNHLHFLVEGAGRVMLMNGLKALAIRVAKAINRALGRCGKVIESRYHARALGSPREVRNALVYVLLNYKHHEKGANGIDVCSSGRWFRGWRDAKPQEEMIPVARARTWLLGVGWRRGGLISTRERPKS